jgi:outer membrane protein assembly factor BamB
VRARWIVLAVVSALTLAGCDWPTYMYNAAHSGSSADTSVSAADLSAGLTEKWQAVLGVGSSSNLPPSPVVAKGLVYVATAGGIVEAFETDGGTNCDASVPKKCQPLWRSAPILATFSTASVANGFVYIGGTDNTMYVFDAAGVTNCSPGAPATCLPLWTGSVPGGGASSPVVAGGFVYIGSSDGSVYAFDAAGSSGCNASHVCTALRKFATGSAIDSSPAVANKVLYVGNDSGKFSAFDATGATKCKASHVCQPLWTATTAGFLHSPAVAGGRVFIGSEDGKLYAFDAAGSTGCSGTPKTCAPLWKATTANAVASSPAVANNVVYIGTLAGGSTAARLEAYDANGVTNCSGTPRNCTPIWASTPLGTLSVAPVSVANGVVYITVEIGILSFVGNVFAFDASAPAAHCSGTPKLCSPLAILDPAGDDILGTAPAVVDGTVYLSGTGLHAFAR